MHSVRTRAVRFVDVSDVSAAVATEGLSCWVLSEGMAGTENQCLALAAALGLTPEIKRAAANKPWRWLGAAMAALPPEFLAREHDSLAPPWPDLVIASGRKCAGLALAIQRASRAARLPSSSRIRASAWRASISSWRPAMTASPAPISFPRGAP